MSRTVFGLVFVAFVAVAFAAAGVFVGFFAVCVLDDGAIVVLVVLVVLWIENKQDERSRALRHCRTTVSLVSHVPLACKLWASIALPVEQL